MSKCVICDKELKKSIGAYVNVECDLIHFQDDNAWPCCPDCIARYEDKEHWTIEQARECEQERENS